MNRVLYISLVIALFFIDSRSINTVRAQTNVTCQPLGYDREKLFLLRDSGFEIDQSAERIRFATDLLKCLGHPDPALRDRIAYEGLTTLLRKNTLDQTTIRQLRSALIVMLNGQDDLDNFRKPFAALVLAEVARTDRIDPFFTEKERLEIVETSVAYMKSIDDYRGFDEHEGWRHAVAHTADLFLQLTLNPSIKKESFVKIRDAIFLQVIPKEPHFYIYGESERLARPILFMANRDFFTQEEWRHWFTQFMSPAPYETWTDAYKSKEGLARLHNLKTFMNVIYINASVSERETMAIVKSEALKVLQALP